jgi:hypothetical protein
MIMETKTTRMQSLLALHDWQTDFFKSSLAGISDADAHKRLDTKANHIAWLAGSLVEQRFEGARMLGDSEMQQQAHELFKDNKGIQDGTSYPSLASYIADWERITPVLRGILMNVDDARLDVTFEMMPGQKMSNYDMVVFMTYREANCIGQIALWRRLLGYDAMKYM